MPSLPISRPSVSASSSRAAALIRAAISEYLATHRRPALRDAFGLWGTAATNGLAYQEKLRAEW